MIILVTFVCNNKLQEYNNIHICNRFMWFTFVNMITSELSVKNV